MAIVDDESQHRYVRTGKSEHPKDRNAERSCAGGGLRLVLNRGQNSESNNEVCTPECLIRLNDMKRAQADLPP